MKYVKHFFQKELILIVETTYNQYKDKNQSDSCNI